MLRPQILGTVLALVLPLSAGALAQSPDVQSVFALGAAADGSGAASERVRFTAARDGTLIAWVECEGAELALSVLSADDDELAREPAQGAPRIARLEIPVRAGDAVALLIEADGVLPWAWARAGAAVASETELTRAAPGRAREALDAARRLAASGDLEGQRAVLSGAVSELLALPGREHSRAAADALWSLTFEAYSAGALESALSAASASLETRRRFEPDASANVQRARIGVGIVLSELGRFEEAAAVAEQVEALYARTLSADDPELAKVRLNLANALHRTGELARPVRLVRDALDVYECHLPPDHPERRRAESSVVELDLALGRTEEAEVRSRALYRSALEAGDEEEILGAAGNYAIALGQLGEHELARQIEAETLARCERRLPAGHPVLDTLRQNLAASLIELGDWPRARELLEQVLAGIESSPGMDRTAALRPLCNLGELERRRGNPAEARALFERALALAEEHEDPSWALMPLNGFAQTLIAAGELAEGQAALERLLAARVESEGENSFYALSARASLAECLRLRGEWQRCIELGEETLAPLSARLSADDSRVFETRLLVLLARASAGESERAAAGLRDWMRDAARSLARASLVASPRAVEERAYAWRNDAGTALVLSLELGASEELADAGLALLETRRASGLWASEALRAASESPDSAQLRAKLARTSRELARAGAAEPPDPAQVERLTAAKDEAEHGLIAGLAPGPATARFGEPVDCERLRAALKADEAAVSYLCTAGSVQRTEAPPHVLAVVLRSSGAPRWVDLGPEEALDRAALRWRAALGTQGAPAASAKEQHEAGEALRRLAFDPLRAHLEGAARAFVVPDGSLHLVALDALPQGGGVLGDELPLLTVPTLAVLEPRLERREPARDVVLVGGLDYGEGELPALADSAEEIARVAELYRAAKREVRLLSGAGADRDTFAAEVARAGILHIATHGELTPRDFAAAAGTAGAAAEPTRGAGGRSPSWTRAAAVRELSPLALCGLALSGANARSAGGERPGFVRGVELASLDASRCELVVLSACDTRAGVARPGLSLASLEKAMHMAGARTVLASLWQVDDEASRELMIAFHRGLALQGLRPAQALWEAKRQLRNRRQPMRAWAGWVLSTVDAAGGR